jgi:beta-1,4-mannosyltransferase
MKELQFCLYPKADPEGSIGNPYLQILGEGLNSHGIAVVGWRWDTILRPPTAVLVNWGEHRWLPLPNRLRSVRSLLRRPLFLLQLRLLRIFGTVVVHVAHNAKPHQWDGSQEEWNGRICSYLKVIDAAAFLTNSAREHPAFALLRDNPWCVLPHPHYGLLPDSEFATMGLRVSRLVFLGGLAPRKDALAAIVLASRMADIEVIVTGSGDASALRERIGPDEWRRVTLIEGHVPEVDLYNLVRFPAAVVLSQRDALNSGVVFLALSRGTPVICPDNPTNVELQAEFGPDWIRTFEGELDAEQLSRLLERPIGTRLPDMTRRTPGAIVTDLIALIHKVRSQSE